MAITNLWHLKFRQTIVGRNMFYNLTKQPVDFYENLNKNMLETTISLETSEREILLLRNNEKWSDCISVCDCNSGQTFGSILQSIEDNLHTGCLGQNPGRVR